MQITSKLKYLLLAVIFILPLIQTYKGFGFEEIKVLFFILSISLIGLIWLFSKIKLNLNLIKIAALVFILILFITSGLGVDLRQSLLGKEPYFQGLILYAYLFLFSLLVSSVAIKLEHVAIVLSASATIVYLLAIQDWVLLNIFNHPVQTYAGRVVSTFGQPNFYAGFLLLALPFSYLLFKSSDRRLQFLGWTSGVTAFVGIIVSYSRASILLALLLLILGLLDQLKRKLKIGVVVCGALLVSVVLAWQLSSGIIENEISRQFLTKNPDLTSESVEKRAYIWPEALKVISKKPLIGYGLENTGIAFSRYFEENKHLLFEENLKISPVLISLKELNIDRTHNYSLDLLIFSGGSGLLAWIVLVGLLFWRLKQKSNNLANNTLLVGLVIYLAWIQFQNQSVVHLMYFWLLVGLVDQDSA